MEKFEYVNPPEVPDEVTNRISNEIEYLKQTIRNIMLGGKNNV